MSKLTVVSLGAGIQSTTLVLLAARGAITPMPDAAIFADTGAEPKAVYAHLNWLCESGRLPFPVHRVTAGDLGAALLAGQSNARPPLYVKNENGSRGMLRRQCTGDFKIDPIEKRIRLLLGLRHRQRWPKTAVVEQWLGISTDEASRMKPSRRPAIVARWPLIERGMSRRDCIAWLTRNDYPIPPKSACTFCPFRSDHEWRQLRDSDPDGWAEAVAVDEAVRTGMTQRGKVFVHRSLRPLSEVDLSTAEDRGQATLNLFENECEGVCGV